MSEEEGPLSIVHAMQLHEGHLKLQMYGCAAIANVTFGGMFCWTYKDELFVLKIVQVLSSEIEYLPASHNCVNVHLYVYACIHLFVCLCVSICLLLCAYVFLHLLSCDVSVLLTRYRYS